MTTPRPVLRMLQPLLERLVTTARMTSDSVASVAWLLGPGDVCATCPAAPRCSTREVCLHRVATSAEGDVPEETQARVPLGSGPLGRALSTREPAVADPAELALAEPGWLATRGVRAAACVPLDHGGRPIGVLVVLAQATPSEERLQLLASTAALGAEAIANVSAYRDLADDRNRLAAVNARLRAGLGLPPEPEPPPARRPAPPPVAPPVPSPPPASSAAGAPAPPGATAPSPGPRVAEPVATSAAAGSAPTPPPSPAGVGAGPALGPEVLSALGAMLHAEVAAGLPVRPFSEVQREGILRALERTHWRVSGPNGAASLLGLKPTTLESKMKKLGIRRPLRQR
jgi:hypothetical protein